MKVRILRWSLILTMCLTISGCGILPQQVVETKYVVIHPGKPLQILEMKKPVLIVGRTLDDRQDVAGQNITGWVTMPPEHWQSVKAVLDWYAKYKAGLEGKPIPTPEPGSP